MERKNIEITQQAKSVSQELKQVQNDFYTLVEINHAFSTENDNLKKRIKLNDDFDCDDLKIIKKRNKGKSITQSEDELYRNDRMDISSGEQIEANEKDARVCNNNYSYFLL